MSFHQTYSMNERYNMSIPNGWYAVCFSHELKKKEVKPLSILNKELVIFRSEKGKASVLEAYCPHQGTHLGYGGKVFENSIVCPFHRWRFDGNGKCIEIPYSNRIPGLDRNCLNSLPTVEQDNIVFVYFHKENIKPDFYLPDFDAQFNNDSWTKPRYTSFFIKTHIQEFGENGFDVAHFKPVHGSERNAISVESPVTDKVMRYKLNLVYPGLGMGLPMSKVNVIADWAYHGLSVFTNTIQLDKFPIKICQNYYFTPQNDGQIIIRFSLRINKDTLPGNFLLKWIQTKLIYSKNIKMVLRNFDEDRLIWENKIFRPMPVLCEGDGPVLHYRKWAQQFY